MHSASGVEQPLPSLLLTEYTVKAYCMYCFVHFVLLRFIPVFEGLTHHLIALVKAVINVP